MNLRKRLIIGIGFLLFLIFTTFAAVYLVKKPQNIQKKATGGPASLSLSPSSGNFPKDQTFDINILLNTGDKPVVGVDVSLTFESTKLQAQSVTPGSLFQGQIVFKNEISNGKILLSLGSFTPFTGSGVYGTIRFLAAGTGDTQVLFDAISTKVAQQGGGNILGQTINGSYTISESTIPTATPGPSSKIKFSIKFNGMGQEKPDLKVRLLVFNESTGEKLYFKDITATASSDLTYRPTDWVNLTNVRLGEGNLYSIFLKGPKHLQKKMTRRITLTEGESEKNIFDWTFKPLELGDLPNPNKNYEQDGKADSTDASLLLERLNLSDEASLRVADLNYDGVVNLNDYSLLIQTLSTKYEEED